MIPECPICGEMPYSTEQCYWCGQRFVQDEEVEEYATPQTIKGNCFNCGADVVIHVSKYNGHKSYPVSYTHLDVYKRQGWWSLTVNRNTNG